VLFFPVQLFRLIGSQHANPSFGSKRTILSS
jgi:hypothetical protein